MQRRPALTSRDERGSVLIFVALVMVVILGFAALAVDLGNARQRRGNTQVAVDGGALAGAYALKGSGAPICASVLCTAAYYTFQSLGIPVGSSLPSTGSCGASCSRFVLQDATVDVTSPYPFHGDDPSQYVHVRSCWKNKNAFAPVLGFPLSKVCATATAQNSNGSGGPTGSPDPSFDCVGQDNLADAHDSPTIFPKAGQDVKAGTTIGATFHSSDSSLDLASLDFEAPDATGQTVRLTYDPAGTHGYKLEPPPPPGGIYPNQTDVKISYKLPNAPPLPKTDSANNRIVYEAKLHVAQILQDNPPECGNASWKFTWDGKGITSGSACGEDSFINSVYPRNGTVVPGDHIGAIYTDESALQDQPWSEDFPFGVKFTLSGPGWTDAAGNPTFVPYTLSDGSAEATKKDKFNTKIDYQLPDASKFFAGAVYTASLTAYDTDQNKPGNDCGHATWTFTVAGGTAGFIRLVE